MTAVEYQKLAARTLVEKPDGAYTDQDMMLVWTVLGLVGEAIELFDTDPADHQATKKELGDVYWYVAGIYTVLGREMPEPTAMYTGSLDVIVLDSGALAEYVKKGVFHRHGIDPAVMMRYMTCLVNDIASYAKRLGLDRETVMEANIEKLRQRYPDGYSSEASKGWETTR